MRLLVGVSLLALAMPVQAQTTLDEYLDKALLEVNATKNAAARSEYAIKRAKEKLKGQQPAPTPIVEPAPPPVPTPVQDPTPTPVIPNDPAPTQPSVPDPTPDPEPPMVDHPPAAGYIPSPTLDGAAPIQSEFDWKLATVPLVNPPGTAAPDVVGAFRFSCGSAGLGRFDPKVFPGDKTGKSHLHQFYGNTGINPNSTYESLRTSGKSTCGYGDFPLNRSAYWEPAVLDENGNVVQQDHSTIYYKRRPKSDPKCQKQADPWQGMQCVDLPNGLFFIFGFDFITDKAPTGKLEWGCLDAAGKAFYAGNIPDATASGLCTVGGRVVSRLVAPGCWDGKNLDSPNHRDHVSYATVRNPVSGQYRCPDTHPFIFPQFTLLTSRQIKLGDKPHLWKVSSDAMRPDLKNGSTMHADFWMAHDPQFKFEWGVAPDSCIEGLLSCSGYPINKRLGWKMANQPFYWNEQYKKLMPNWLNPEHIVAAPGDEANTSLVYSPYVN